ncbi:MAG: KH domain-containing protein [Pyrinomonadaceae bacterium]
MKEAVEKLVKNLVGQPDAVEVSEKPGNSENTTIISVRVGAGEMGRIIGREGRTIKAIRSLLYAASQKQRKRFVLEVVE